MAKPTLIKKYVTEGNPFGQKIMTNIAEIVSWMYNGFTGDKSVVPVPKFITAGKTLCERQIANMDEVVQWMYDNWAGEKGEDAPTPAYAYATEGMAPMGVQYIENISDVVAAMFEQMEASDAEGEEDEPEGQSEDTPEYVYTLVDKDEVVIPEDGVEYWVKDGDDYVLGGVTTDGEFEDCDVYTRSIAE